MNAQDPSKIPKIRFSGNYARKNFVSKGCSLMIQQELSDLAGVVRDLLPSLSRPSKCSVHRHGSSKTLVQVIVVDLPGNSATRQELSGPLNRLNAILSLLHPLNRYRTPSAIGSAIGRPLSRPISRPNTGGSPQPPRSKPLRGAQPRDGGAIVSQTPLEQARNKNAIEAAILNHVLDRD